MVVVLTGTSAQSFWSMVAVAPKTLPSPPPVDAEMLVHVPAAPDRMYRRLVICGCGTMPLPYTASITSEASGAHERTLHWFVIVLSMTAVVLGGDVPATPVGLTLLPNPLVHVAAVSTFVDRPTAQSTS